MMRFRVYLYFPWARKGSKNWPKFKIQIKVSFVERCVSNSDVLESCGYNGRLYHTLYWVWSNHSRTCCNFDFYKLKLLMYLLLLKQLSWLGSLTPCLGCVDTVYWAKRCRPAELGKQCWSFLLLRNFGIKKIVRKCRYFRTTTFFTYFKYLLFLY